MPWNTSGTFAVRLSVETLTANREILWPNIDGTVAVGAGIGSGVSLLTLHRIDQTAEGGQLNFNRAAEDGLAWAIDVFGSGSVATSLRFLDMKAATVPMFIDQSSGAVVMDRLNVSATAAFSGPIVGLGTTTLSSLAVAVNTVMGGNLDVAGRLSASALAVNNLAVGGTLSVSGATVMAGNLDVAGRLSASAIAIGNLFVGGTLSVSGAAAMADNLTVAGSLTTGGLTALGNVRFASNFSVSGIAVINGTLTLNSNLSVGGATHLAGSVSAAGNVMIGGNFTVSGVTVLNGTTTLNSNLNVSGVSQLIGAVTLFGTLTVSATAVASAFTGKNTAKAWVRFSLGGTTSNFNISSISNLADSTFDIKFINNIGANACGLATAVFPAGTGAARAEVRTLTTGSANVAVFIGSVTSVANTIDFIAVNV